MTASDELVIHTLISMDPKLIADRIAELEADIARKDALLKDCFETSFCRADVWDRLRKELGR